MGKELYGSLHNRMLENSNGQPVPQVGMGATECMYSDRHAYEIIEVKDERHIVVRQYDTKRIDNNGMSESQEYEYISNPNNPTRNLFLTKQGRWRERVGQRGLGRNGWVIGRATEYYDYSF